MTGGWRRHERRSERPVLVGLSVLGLLAILSFYLLDLFAFVEAIPTEVADPESHTDAIVVLTGGGQRLAVGFELLSSGKAERLFISGVNRQVERSELRSFGPVSEELMRCCVTLGYGAGDTIGNAAETAAWAEREHVRSIRLVTAGYHMQRSLLEMRRAMPGIALVPHPVFPTGFQPDGWWRRAGAAELVLGEYNKLLGARVRHALRDIILSRPQ